MRSFHLGQTRIRTSGIAWLLLCAIGFGCKSSTPDLRTFGDRSITVFADQHHRFDPEFFSEKSTDEVPAEKEDETEASPSGEDLYLDAGRTILRRLILPRFERHVDVELRMRLESAGDPWDKLGSVFILPNSALKDFLALDAPADAATDQSPDSTLTFPGVVSDGPYTPVVELMRFITPFGVGAYSGGMEDRRPVFVPQWADDVRWTRDLSPLAGLLRDTVWIGVFIDTWTREGYSYSLELHFDESEIPGHAFNAPEVIPIANTLKLLSGQRLYDEFSRTPLEVDIVLPEGLQNARLLYTPTGHGGHAEGDEFSEHEHRIILNEQLLHRFTPWRDDCASFRRFNPHSGVWTEPVEWKGRQIEERIASSDYSRSNWCPGSDVDPEAIPLSVTSARTDRSENLLRLRFEVENAQPIREGEYNYWAVAAYILADVK